MRTIWVCDDEEIYLNYILACLQEHYGNAVWVETFHSSTDLMEMASRALPDILLLDIELGQENGIRLVERIAREFPRSHMKLLYFTAYAVRYCQRIFIGTMKPDAYLTKPILKDYLFYHIDQCLQALDIPTEGEQYTYQKNHTLCSVPCNTLKFLESDGHKITIHTQTEILLGEFFGKLDDAEMQLSQEFVRTHKSYLVNMAFIKEMTARYVTLFDGMCVPMSRRYFPEAKRRYFIYRGLLL